MNILWLSHVIPYPPKTGVLQRSFNLLNETSKIGDVYLLALHKKSVLPMKYDIAEVKQALGAFCKHVDILEIPAELSRYNFYKLILKCFLAFKSLSIGFYDSDIMRSKIKEIISKVNFDIVYFDTVSLVPYSDGPGMLRKILNHHNFESGLLRQRSDIEKNPLKKLFYRVEAKRLAEYEKTHCPSFDINFTVSENDKVSLTKLIPQLKIEVIPNGVDTDYFFFDQDHIIDRTLVIVSGMNWYPNRDAVEYMCREIWPILSKTFPDITLTIVGSNPPKTLLDLAEVDKRVIVTGFVEDVRPFLQKAEIYLCPMRDGGGTRLKILDAMSMGKAIVSTSKGCEGIEVTPNTNVLIADSPAKFVSEISRVFGSSAMRDEIGKSARKLVEEKYSWQNIGKTLKKIYYSIQ